MGCLEFLPPVFSVPGPGRRAGARRGLLGVAMSALFCGVVFAQSSPPREGSAASPDGGSGGSSSGKGPEKKPDKAANPIAEPRATPPASAAGTPRVTLRGSLLAADGSIPKQAAVFVEGIAASAFSVPSAPLVISQRGARFRPDFAVAVVGQLVELPNDDRIIHNVFSVSPVKKFDLGHYGQGEKRSVRFERSGSVELFCGIHETMQGLIVVAPSPHFALVGADGSFAIPAVPPGKYQLVAYTRSGAQARQPIEVGPEGPAAISLTLAGR
jgi:plastocyanin